MAEANAYPWLNVRLYVNFRYALAAIGTIGLLIFSAFLPQYRALSMIYMAVAFIVALLVAAADIACRIAGRRGYEVGIILFSEALDVISLIALDIATRVHFSITFSPIFLVLLVTLQGMYFFWRLLPGVSGNVRSPLIITGYFLIAMGAGDVVAALRFGNFSLLIEFLKAFTILTFHMFIAQYYGLLLDTITAQLRENRTLNEKLIGAMKFIVSGEIFSVMLHDLKNMMHTIVMALEGIRVQSAGSDAGARFYPIINRNIDDIEKIISQFLSYVRLDPKAEEDVDVLRVVREALDFVRLSRKNAGTIQFAVSGLDDAPVIMTVSKYRLLSVFLNIITNAVQSLNSVSMENRKVSLNAARIGDTAVIVIDDNGPGIAPEDMPKIFTVFTTKDDGLGLGLSFVHDYVTTTLGGEITVSSVPGVRTTFTVRLPIKHTGGKHV